MRKPFLNKFWPDYKKLRFFIIIEKFQSFVFTGNLLFLLVYLHDVPM